MPTYEVLGRRRHNVYDMLMCVKRHRLLSSASTPPLALGFCFSDDFSVKLARNPDRSFLMVTTTRDMFRGTELTGGWTYRFEVKYTSCKFEILDFLVLAFLF